MPVITEEEEETLKELGIGEEDCYRLDKLETECRDGREWYKKIRKELKEWKRELYKKIKDIEKSLSEKEEELIYKFQEEIKKLPWKKKKI